jgi:hypothetical protein
MTGRLAPARGRGAGGAVRAAIMGPLWVAQLFTGAKSFADNPLLRSRTLNRNGLHCLRIVTAHRLAHWRRRGLAARVAAADREAFARDGIVVKPGFLPPPLFDRLLADIAAYRGPAREEIQGDTITRRIALSPSALRRMPAVAAVLELPAFQDLLRYAGGFDAEPMFYAQTILTKAHAGPSDPQCNLHADTFHPTLKAWLFLTDVAEDAAPFTYVPGSHAPTPARLDWEGRRSLEAHRSPDIRTRRGSFRVDPEELAALGLPPAKRFAVPANTLVIADTFGFHARGPSAGPARRVEIFAYLRHSPFLPWTRLWLWNLTPLARRRADAFWRWSDLVEGLGGGPAVWRRHPARSPFDP